MDTSAPPVAPTPDPDLKLHSPERLTFFSDAVIAIAMTLLILPLMESVSEAEQISTADWLAEHADPLISFGISFAVIALMWILHHGTFAKVQGAPSAVFLPNLLWLATIVFLPVATALSNATEPDTLQHVIYIGTMLLSALLLVVINAVLARAPGVTDDPLTSRRHLAAALAMVVCLATALVIAVTTPANNAALFVMLLVPVLQRVFARILTAGRR